ncbi:hypothetical protein ACIRH0_04025 [Streptomyces sp. NPDC093675]|uniref:hypothetical protein n=1 Tax=unclassified Streptomyces TaxID=2593676 RepID=UPI0034407EE9
MDPITILLVVLGFLLPSITALISSKADRNRAAGKAEIIRARRGCQRPHRELRKGRPNV